jgi:hypothetical protein
VRHIAVVPLYAVTLDGRLRDTRPTAWGTVAATAGDYELRTFRHQGVYFEA